MFLFFIKNCFCHCWCHHLSHGCFFLLQLFFIWSSKIMWALSSTCFLLFFFYFFVVCLFHINCDSKLFLFEPQWESEKWYSALFIYLFQTVLAPVETLWKASPSFLFRSPMLRFSFLILSLFLASEVLLSYNIVAIFSASAGGKSVSLYREKVHKVY